MNSRRLLIRSGTSTPEVKAPISFCIVAAAALIAATIDLHVVTGGARDSTGMAAGDYSKALILGTIYLLASAILLADIKAVLKLVKVTLPYVLLLPLIIVSIIWSNVPFKVVTAFIHAVGYMLVAIVIAIWTQGDHVRLARLILIPSAIVLALSVAISIYLPSVGVDYASERPRWMGLAYHPNTLGVVSLIAVWSAVSLLQERQSAIVRIILCLTIGLAAVCLYKSNSVTSIVLALAMLGLVLWVTVLRATDSVVATCIFFSIFGLIASVVVYLVDPELFSLDRLLSVFGRNRTFTGRVGLWEIAMQAHSERPFFGWSYDFLGSLSRKYSIRYGQFHNGYLDLLVRGGYVGLFAVGAVIVQLFLRIVKLLSINPAAASCYGALAVAILVHNLTEASLVRPPHPMWLVFSALVFCVAEASQQGAARKMERMIQGKYSNILGGRSTQFS